MSVIAVYMMRVSTPLGAGLFILLFAFMSSIFVSVGWIGEYWRVVIVVENNPGAHIDLVRRVFLYGILPIAIGLTLCVSAYMKKGKISMEGFRNLLMLMTGGFSTIWGIHYFQVVYRDYFRAINMAQEENVSYLNDSLQAIYTTYGLVSILWLITGTFLIVVSVRILYRLRRVSNNITVSGRKRRVRDGTYINKTQQVPSSATPQNCIIDLSCLVLIE